MSRKFYVITEDKLNTFAAAIQRDKELSYSVKNTESYEIACVRESTLREFRTTMTEVDLDDVASDWLGTVRCDCFHDIGGLIQEMPFTDYLLAHIKEGR